jgi:hypothetical protein
MNNKTIKKKKEKKKQKLKKKKKTQKSFTKKGLVECGSSDKSACLARRRPRELPRERERERERERNSVLFFPAPSCLTLLHKLISPLRMLFFSLLIPFLFKVAHIPTIESCLFPSYISTHTHTQHIYI